MAAQSRSRPTRTSGHSVSKQRITPPAKSLAADRQARHIHNNGTHRISSPLSNDDEPPAKKRKLSIRSKQSTLDNFAIAQSGQLKPPTKVSVAQPGGQLLETVNGVRNKLDADEDEICRPTRRTETPKPSRVPQPEQKISSEPAKQEDKRTLRSQDDGPRLKSELAI